MGHQCRKWKGIILAAGAGTRMLPVTQSVRKELLPVYDKPMIYYPLSVLMLAGIRDVLLITSPADLSTFRALLGDGSQWGIRIDYSEQPQPEGLAQAFIIGRKFIGRDNVCLILGDNIIHGHRVRRVLRRAVELEKGALVFGYRVRDPERYGVVEFDASGNVVSVEEKPTSPRSNYAVIGLYFFDDRVGEIASGLVPAGRGELEMADILNTYLRSGELLVEVLGRGVKCFDAGTHESLLEASKFVRSVEKRKGLKVACVEEVAYRMGYIDSRQLMRLAEPLRQSGYGQYLLKLIADNPKKVTAEEK